MRDSDQNDQGAFAILSSLECEVVVLARRLWLAGVEAGAQRLYDEVVGIRETFYLSKAGSPDWGSAFYRLSELERKLLVEQKIYGVDSDPSSRVGSTAIARTMVDAWELLFGTLVEIPLAFGQAVASRVDAPEGSPADDPYSAIRPKRACRKCNYDLTGSTRYRCADCMESFDLLLVRENASACPTCPAPSSR